MKLGDPYGIDACVHEVSLPVSAQIDNSGVPARDLVGNRESARACSSRGSVRAAYYAAWGCGR
jgi:hypothetical protein